MVWIGGWFCRLILVFWQWLSFNFTMVVGGVEFVVVVLWQRWVCCSGVVVVCNGNIKQALN